MFSSPQEKSFITKIEFSFLKRKQVGKGKYRQIAQMLKTTVLQALFSKKNRQPVMNEELRMVNLIIKNYQDSLKTKDTDILGTFENQKDTEIFAKLRIKK